MAHPSGMEKAKKWVDLIAGLSVIATMGFIALQWLEMRRGSVDTHDLAVAAKSQADAAKTQADNTRLIAESAKSQAANTEKLALAAADQANAAINAASTAKRELDISVQSFHVHTSHWIGLGSILPSTRVRTSSI